MAAEAVPVHRVRGRRQIARSPAFVNQHGNRNPPFLLDDLPVGHLLRLDTLHSLCNVREAACCRALRSPGRTHASLSPRPLPRPARLSEASPREHSAHFDTVQMRVSGTFGSPLSRDSSGPHPQDAEPALGRWRTPQYEEVAAFVDRCAGSTHFLFSPSRTTASAGALL